jgi:hypothetical protein
LVSASIADQIRPEAAAADVGIAIGTVVMLLTGVLAQQVFMSTGMLVHEVSVLVVILNAVRLVRYKSRARDNAGRGPASTPSTEVPEGVASERSRALKSVLR